MEHARQSTDNAAPHQMMEKQNNLPYLPFFFFFVFCCSLFALPIMCTSTAFHSCSCQTIVIVNSTPLNTHTLQSLCNFFLFFSLLLSLLLALCYYYYYRWSSLKVADKKKVTAAVAFMYFTIRTYVSVSVSVCALFRQPNSTFTLQPTKQIFMFSIQHSPNK